MQVGFEWPQHLGILLRQRWVGDKFGLDLTGYIFMVPSHLCVLWLSYCKLLWCRNFFYKYSWNLLCQLIHHSDAKSHSQVLYHDTNVPCRVLPVNLWKMESHGGLRLWEQTQVCGNSTNHQTRKIVSRDFSSHGCLIQKEVLAVSVGHKLLVVL